MNSFNDIMYPMLVLGIIGAGGIFTGTNPSYTPLELTHHFKTSGTRYIITEPEMLESTLKAAKECNIPRSNILIFNVLGQPIPNDFRSWETLLECGEADWIRFDDLDTARRTEAARLFSSGTTGLPKAAMLSHHNLVAQHILVFDDDIRDFETRRLLCLPMFHAAIAPIAHTSTLKSGYTAIVMRRFELEPFLANIEKHKITDLLLVPPLVIATIMSPLAKKYSLLSLKVIRCGAAPLGKGPQKTFEDLVGGAAPFTQVWGKLLGLELIYVLIQSEIRHD